MGSAGFQQLKPPELPLSCLVSKQTIIRTAQGLDRANGWGSRTQQRRHQPPGFPPLSCRGHLVSLSYFFLLSTFLSSLLFSSPLLSSTPYPFLLSLSLSLSLFLSFLPFLPLNTSILLFLQAQEPKGAAPAHLPYMFSWFRYNCSCLRLKEKQTGFFYTHNNSESKCLEVFFHTNRFSNSLWTPTGCPTI